MDVDFYISPFSKSIHFVMIVTVGIFKGMSHKCVKGDGIMVVRVTMLVVSNCRVR